MPEKFHPHDVYLFFQLVVSRSGTSTCSHLKESWQTSNRRIYLDWGPCHHIDFKSWTANCPGLSLTNSFRVKIYFLKSMLADIMSKFAIHLWHLRNQSIRNHLPSLFSRNLVYLDFIGCCNTVKKDDKDWITDQQEFSSDFKDPAYGFGMHRVLDSFTGQLRKLEPFFVKCWSFRIIGPHCPSSASHKFTDLLMVVTSLLQVSQ